MIRPDRIPVLDPLDVVPHAVAVDEVAAGRLGDADHASVDVRGHAGHHVLRRRAEALGPVGAHEVVVAADAAGGDEDDRRAQLEAADAVAVGRDAPLGTVVREPGSADADDGTPFDDDLVDAVAVGVGDQAALLGLGDPSGERGDDPRPRAPRDVESRHGVAVPVR